MNRSLPDANTIIDFGKHKGRFVQWVIDNEPSYLLWLADETDIDISPSVLDDAQISFDNETFGG